VDYLGHVVSAAGVAPEPKKIASIKNAELRSFVGLCSYYRKFVKGCFENIEADNKVPEHQA
jgi:hypothetical protein